MTKTFNVEEALIRCGDDPQTLIEIAELFFADYQKTLNAIRDGISEGDSDKLNGAIHTLKGCLGNLGANGAFELAREIEADAKKMGADVALVRFKELTDEIERFRGELNAFKEHSA